MFIVKQKISGNDYYYLRKSIREGDKVISKCVAYLGKDKEQAELKAKEIERKMNEPESPNVEIKKKPITIEELTNFCKEKGFVFRSSDIYGGYSGFWDFGPLGVELFNNIKQNWWNWFVRSRDDMAGMEASIISHPRTWKASGHIENFEDISVKCKKCGKASKLDENELGKVNCPDCGGEYESQGKFNLMFKTKVGSVDAEDAYLRGETAQGMFMNFKLIQQTSRKQLPFGIAQIGRCFRNEIAPRDFLFRCREFHIGEFEFFIHPDEMKCSLLEDSHREVKLKLLDEETQNRMGEESPNPFKKGLTQNKPQQEGTSHPSLKDKDDLRDATIGEMLDKKKLDEWHAYWLAEQILWFNSIGLTEIKIREHTKDELSHYSSATFDVDYTYPFGSQEVAGNANRGQYDLTQHQKESKESMEIFDEGSKSKIIPRVIEPTFGMERVFLAILTKAYCYDAKRDYVVLKIPAKLAPVKAAVFPIIKKEEYIALAEDIVRDLKKDFNINYDKSGSIGRRYARNDEMGTPFCITIDGDSLEGKDVTIRNRDSGKQIRVKVDKLKGVLRGLVEGDIKFEKAGKIVK